MRPAFFWIVGVGLWTTAALAGCVGPTTPLGAVDDPVGGTETTAVEVGSEEAEPSVAPPRAGAKAALFFSPSVQRVHGPYTWRILVLDPSATDRPSASRLRVFYNGLEVTQAARFQFEVEAPPSSDPHRQTLLLSLPHLRLDPMAEHAIRVTYRTAAGETVSARYRFPRVRDLEAPDAVATIRPFSVDAEVLEAIHEASRRYHLSPALVAALIAQESSFDPFALSKASALGLTQVTHLAERDIAPHFPGWPRYPGIRRLSRRRLRRSIPGVVNGSTEWRLDPVKSVWGGAYYLGHLRDRLRHEGNRPYLRRAGLTGDDGLAEACLAAYNSGLNRILFTMDRYGEGWLDQRETREAKRYVRKILSYYGAFRGEPALPL